MAGRPRKDTLDTQRIILNLAKSGMNNIQIADVTGVSVRTIQHWLADTDLGEAINATRAAMRTLEADEKAKLNKSAIAATKKLLKKHRVTETIERTDDTGKLLYTETRTKEVDPNAGIVQFVLRNTDPQNWNDQPAQQEMDGADDNDLTIEIVDGEDEN